MGLSTNDNHTTRIISMYSLFSLTYMSIYMFILIYLDNLYNIGKRNCILLIVGIAIAECVKLFFPRLTRENTNVRDKSTKTKKFQMKNVFKSILLLIVMIFIYYFIAVLFGAPFISQQEENLMFSSLLTVLTVLPSCLNLGPDATISLLTGATACQNDIIVTMIKRIVYLTLFGAWLGAIVIPLDWDRSWQVWPIPCSLGAVLGYSCSHIVTLINLAPKITRLFGKKTGKYGL